jgi:hypothetical protein
MMPRLSIKMRSYSLCHITTPKNENMCNYLVPLELINRLGHARCCLDEKSKHHENTPFHLMPHQSKKNTYFAYLKGKAASVVDFHFHRSQNSLQSVN